MQTLHAPVPTPAPRRRRLWPWVVAILLSPFLVVAVAAYSYLTLDRTASSLRRQVMRAVPADWHTKVQVSVGDITLDAVRTGLCFVHCPHIGEARQALATVRHASVGVYQSRDLPEGFSVNEFIRSTNATMAKRGWAPVVAVVDGRSKVLVYGPEKADGDEIDLCLAVVEDRQLIVMSATMDADALAQLLQSQIQKQWHERIGKLALR